MVNLRLSATCDVKGEAAIAVVVVVMPSSSSRINQSLLLDSLLCSKRLLGGQGFTIRKQQFPIVFKSVATIKK